MQYITKFSHNHNISQHTLTEFSCLSTTLEVVLTGETLDVVLHKFDGDIDLIEAPSESDDLQ